MKMKSLFITSALALATSALIPNSAHATVLIYEGFSYASGSLVGQTITATGLTGNYTAINGNTAPSLGTGLTFGSGATTYAVTGGSASMSTGVYNGLQGKLNTGDITGTLYGSYLFNESPNNFGARFTSQFTPASASGNFFTAQAENGSARASLKYSAGGTATTLAVSYTPGATYMAISKWTNVGGAGGGTGTLWVLNSTQYDTMMAGGNLNETYLNVGIPNVTWTLSMSDGTTQALLGTGYWQTYFGSGSGTPTERIDEVKFGTELADVASVPEPATWALLALSLTTVTVLRRRRG